jgi:hypothetical protein
MTFQEKTQELQPYLIGIRYLEKMVVVDVVFKEEWNIPEDQHVKKLKGDKDVNYYMIYSETEGVGLDELLAYVEKTITLNNEREEKHKLLVNTVNKLKELFKKNNLSKLRKLKFTFEDETMIPELSELDDTSSENKKEEAPIIETPIAEPALAEISEVASQPTTYLDENKNPIPLTEEDKEIIEEERRAEVNRKLLAEKKKQTVVSKISGKVELPPKRTIQDAITNESVNNACNCSEEEFCSKCMDSKGL